MSDNPLVSFCVKCYNQERYIREAMEGALAQTYRPLEIVVSDDASTDASVSTIRTVLSDYGAVLKSKEDKSFGGCERYALKDVDVTLLTNRKNNGNCGNWQILCEHARGKLFVKADGDDVSLPERTARIVEEWHRAGETCGVVFHNAIKIDCSGREIGTADKEVFKNNFALGAVMACVRECVDCFDRCKIGTAYDDAVYATRAHLLGLVDCRFDEKLVRYRVGSGESTVGSSYVQSLRKNLHVIHAMTICILSDIDYLRAEGIFGNWDAFYENNREMRDRLEMEFALWESSKFFERLRSFVRLHKKLSLNKETAIHSVLLLPAVISKPFLDYIYRKFASK